MKTGKRSLLLFAVLLLLGVLMAVGAWYWMGMKDSAWLTALIFGPIIIYLFFSGSVGEVGYKDFKLVFSEAANQPVKGDFGTIAPSADDMIQVGDQGIGLLEDMLAQYSLSEEKPILMMMRLGENYPREITLGFIEKLSRYRSFRFVVFVNRQKRFVAYTPVWAIRQRLSKPALGAEFLDVVQNPGRQNELFNYPNIFKETIKTDRKNLEALQMMEKLNLSAIPIIDEKSHLQGVLERDQVISQMMLKLAEKSDV